MTCRGGSRLQCARLGSRTIPYGEHRRLACRWALHPPDRSPSLALGFHGGGVELSQLESSRLSDALPLEALAKELALIDHHQTLG